MLNKQPLSINFTKGLDLKSDPYQVQPGNFLALQNSIFTTTGRLTKRNGYNNLTQVSISGTPAENVTTLTTFNNNLTATGDNLYAYSQDTNQWTNQGNIQPVRLDTLSLIRTSTNQSNQDAAVASNGLVCTTYKDSSTGDFFYLVADSSTGQQIIPATALASTAIDVRVFCLGSYFMVMYRDSGANTIVYIAIPIAAPNSPTAPTTAFTSVIASSNNNSYDGIVLNTNDSSSLYIGYVSTTTTIKIGYISSGLVVFSPTTLSSTSVVTFPSMSIDTARGRIVLSGITTASSRLRAWSVTYGLVQTTAGTQIANTSGLTVNNLTSSYSSGVLTVFIQANNTYSYTTSNGVNPQSDYILKYVSALASTFVTSLPVSRSVALASKAFEASNGNTYIVTVYGNTTQTPSASQSNQSTYFLMDAAGNICMKLAYENAGGYPTSSGGIPVLPSISLFNGAYCYPYMVTDFLATVNVTINTAASPASIVQPNAIYTQTGINLAKFQITNQQYSSEIAETLNLTGGILWEYDGVTPVENGFNVFPENTAVTTAGSGGSITAQQYFYSFTYEWTNNQGNIERSAPSIPITITTTGSVSTNTLKVPTLRLTYKVAPNPVRIVGYRWSVGQQIYYQFTSVVSPTLNDPTIDSVTFTDTLADSAILGNPILYTTGGVIENIGAPASIASALFDNRLWLIDAEDQNLLWYSKQVIENVPVEMSDLLTYYVAPTTSAQGSTGKLTAIYPMDDKLILFKKDAIYYVNGTGPDNTGSNSGYSQPIFITSSIGTANPNSIVLIPSGLMFQSDKGIWMLGRDLSTNYVGAPVESYNSSTVLSASNVPGTTQARFILGNRITLMYDYFFDQWATHTNVQAISSTLYNGFHTYLSSSASVYQETPGLYTDGGSPVLLSLTTSWINLAGLQGFERFYFANLLGTYFTPFKLQVGFAFNYNPSPSAYTVVTPDNYTTPWGSEANWGTGASWGADAGSQGQANVFSARMFPSIQKCQSFQVQIQEIYDPTLGAQAGQGLTLSGLALIVGMKRGWRTQSAGKSYG